MKIQRYLGLFSVLLLAVLYLEGISNPINPAWDVKSCSVLVKKPDGTLLTQKSFVPKDTTVEGCFKWSWTSITHPKNCPNWRENIRNACKVAFEKETEQSSLSDLIKGLTNSQGQNIAFEGCVERYTPSGIMQPLDWSIKKVADVLGSDAYKVCTTEPDAPQEPKLGQIQEAPPLQQTIKHVDSLEDQPSQFYLNKLHLNIPKSTSYLGILPK